MRRLVAALTLSAVVFSMSCERTSTPDGFLGRPLPGASPLAADTLARLRHAWDARPADYRPRTRHLEPDGSPSYTNRLFLETSPYLLQHAHNPVNWYPWGDEAFETAQRLDRPVLLSVGYSTCHWCHVMEEESFEDEEIARYVNEHYVAVKVDREERPDVDAIYMSAVQAITGRGGWPMTVWLTADRRPFHGGTYFPPRDGERGMRIGFLTVLEKLADLYTADRARISTGSMELARVVQQSMGSDGAGGTLPDASVLDNATTFFHGEFDATHGGVAHVPKFPSSLPVRVLLRQHRRTGDPEALRMAVLTLEKMAAGGMYDQIGGGFHRYSTDARWLVPHFEKMLYDNALLVRAYLDGYQATGQAAFAAVARDILTYVARDMTSPEGAFYSATDADSPTPTGRREEGWYFTWTPEEISAALGPDDARIAMAYWGITASGNFEGRNIPYVAKPPDILAGELSLDPGRLTSTLARAREQLRAARARRPAPLRDEKILAAWNGLMISAFAHAAIVLDDAALATRATRAAEFCLARLRRDGRLLRSWRDGRASETGFLDDYAFLTAGLLDLFEATSDPRWLREAAALDAVVEARFEDRSRGGAFMTSDDHETLLAREKPGYDGAEPSGNSVQALNLLRLYHLTEREAYRQRAEHTLAAFGTTLAQRPAALTEMLLAVDHRVDPAKEIVIATPRSRTEAAPFLAELRRSFLPNRVLVVLEPGDDIAALVPLAAGKVARNGKVTAYVCENRVCDVPTNDPAEFARQIARVSRS